ncbi:MAG TPA: hypothetical protein VH061_08460 [Solirubrobacteraceae bacterium]|jgi:hypothetical protein|nr:hypothetical protein [Solirubrobacteraceae bacterium]
MIKHYEMHVFKVTDDNGDRAFSFSCPRCGTMNHAWGAGQPDDSARFKAAAAVAGHLMERHSIRMR